MGCGTDTPTGTFVPVATTVTVTPAGQSFSGLGEVAQANATVRDQNGAAMSAASVAWTSSAASVASVSSTGQITAVGNGVATITATSGVASGSVAVSVEQVAGSVTVTSATLVLEGPGSSASLNATVADGGGSAIPGVSLAWTSDDEGVAVVDENGVVTAIAEGATEVTVEASAGGGVVTATAEVTVLEALAVTTSVLPDGVENTDYGTQSLEASGGTGTYAWALEVGSVALPTGLTLAANGDITGTPTVPGTTNVTVEVTSGAQTATQALSIRVNATLMVTTTVLPDGVQNVDYGTPSLAATGGTGTYGWALEAGSAALPPGLDLAANGDITGTPTVAGTTNFTVEVTSGTQTASQSLSVTVNATLVVTTTVLPDGVENVDYGTQSLVATGGTGTYTWALEAGSAALPTGLDLAASGGITGTPTVVGTTNITVEVTSGAQTATQALSIRVNATLVVTTTMLPDGVEKVDYGTQSLAATGGTGTYAWALEPGSAALPIGLDLATNGDITGTPTVVGTTNVTVEVTSGAQTATRALSIGVNATLVVTTTVLPDGVENVDYGTQSLVATGGTGVYAWALEPGSAALPTGLDLAANGDITGTPTEPGTTDITVEVTSGAQTATRALSIGVNATLVVTTTVLPDGVENVDYGTQSLAATGGTGTYAWALEAGSAALPTGLDLAATGDITGTPTVVGTTNVSVAVTSGAQTATRALSIRVNATLVVTTAVLPDGVENADYGTQSLAATGGTGTYAWALGPGSAALPTGLDLAANGDITGTPTVVGTTNFTVEVTSGAQTATQALSITVDVPVLMPSQLCSDFSPTAIATFEDAALESAVRSTLGIGAQNDLTCGLVTGLSRPVIANFSGIVSLVGAQNLTSLLELELRGNAIADVTSLGAITSLTNLDLRQNSVTDISPISTLTGLTRLTIGNNTIIDISSLSTLTAVTYLGLTANAITDIGALGSMTGLEELYAANNEFTDVGPLSALGSLEIARLDGNPLASLTGLGGLASVTLLSIANTGTTDLSPLAGLSTLVTLEIANNPLAGIAPLSGLTNLTLLDMSDTGSTDLGPLSGLTSLVDLDVRDNGVVDISALSGLTSLITLDIRDNSIVDISALSGLTSLVDLLAGTNSILDISALAGLTSLSEIGLNSNPFSNIQALVDNVGLGAGDEVFLNGTNVSCADPNLATLIANSVAVFRDCQ